MSKQKKVMIGDKDPFNQLFENLVDEINLKIGDLIIGGKDTVTLCDGEGFGILDTKKVKFGKFTKKGKVLILKAKVLK